MLLSLSAIMILNNTNKVEYKDTMKKYSKRSIIPTIPRPSKLLAEISSSEVIARTE